jgi:hypothetical protein
MTQVLRLVRRLGNAGAVANAASLLEQRRTEAAAIARLADRLVHVTPGAGTVAA